MFSQKVLSHKTFLLWCLSFVVVGYFCWQARNYQLDDGLIYLRYVRNFFEGNGFVYNSGERFNGLTSPLFSYVLLGLYPLVGDYQATSILSFLILFAPAVFVLGVVLGNKDTLTTAAIIVWVGAFNYFYQTIGMESAQFLLLIVLSLWLYTQERFYALGIALGLLFLTRAEGVLLIAVILADYIWRTRRAPHIKYMLCPAVVVAASLFFNKYYYGDFLPQSGSAKIGQGKSGLWGSGYIFLNVAYMKNWFFGGSYGFVFVLALSALVGVGVSLKQRAVRLGLIFLVLLLSFYVFLNIPNYHWYYAPLYFFTVGFSSVGMVWCARRIAALYASKKATAILLSAAFVTVLLPTAHGSFLLSNKKTAPHPRYEQIGLWLKNNTQGNDAVAMVEVGTVGWYSERPVVDMLGLVSRYNKDFIAKKDVLSWLIHYQPEYVMVHNPVGDMEMSAVFLLENNLYALEPRFPFTDFALLAKNKNVTDEEIVQLVKNHNIRYSK